MTKQQYKRIHKILMKIRATYDPQRLNIVILQHKRGRANYLRFRHVKTSKDRLYSDYIAIRDLALAGPVGKLP